MAGMSDKGEMEIQITGPTAVVAACIELAGLSFHDIPQIAAETGLPIESVKGAIAVLRATGGLVTADGRNAEERRS